MVISNSVRLNWLRAAKSIADDHAGYRNVNLSSMGRYIAPLLEGLEDFEDEFLSHEVRDVITENANEILEDPKTSTVKRRIIQALLLAYEEKYEADKGCHSLVDFDPF